MLDIEDSRSFKSNQDNGELLELSHPQNVGYWDTEEARIFQIKSRFVEPLGYWILTLALEVIPN